MEFLKAEARRVVVKIGTHSLVGASGGLLLERMQDLARQLSCLRAKGLSLVLVSSGAIGAGVRTLGMASRPVDLSGLQACAAVGQPLLMAAWADAFKRAGLLSAQVLLTREDVRGRRRHIAARDTLDKLLAYGVVPIVNENDTISADEIKFGDNDLLSALVASLIKADLLIILSTIPGFMEDHGRGRLIPLVESITPELMAMAGGASDQFSTGGMLSKLEAAKVATQSGCGAFIGSAAATDILLQILQGDAEGTFFMPGSIGLGARKRWIAFFEKPLGQLYLDAGAVAAIRENGTSLLAKGISRFSGDFAEGSVVSLHSVNGDLIGRGLSSFSSSEMARFIGKNSHQIRTELPGRSRAEVVHRDSLVLL